MSLLNLRFLILALTICLTGCKDETKLIDFNTLTPEIINAPEDSVTNVSEGTPLSHRSRISSSTNKFDIGNRLLEFGDSLCLLYHKQTGEEESSSDYVRMIEFANKHLSNKSYPDVIEIDVNGERLEFYHVKTEYSDLDFKFKTEGEYRYAAVINYHFKLSLNKAGNKVEGMKHLIFIADGIIYSPEKLH